MSNWYSSETWLSANDVSAWNPTTPNPTPSDPKALKEEKLANGSATKTISFKNTVPTSGSVKFHELPSNAATHQGAWDAFISNDSTDVSQEQFKTVWNQNKEEELESSSIAPTKTLKALKAITPTDTDVSTTPITSQPTSPTKNNNHRNIDIEAELNKQNLYKTELCQSWGETGTCRYGTKCQFAHGEHELRPVLRHPKYKTEICKTFGTTGHCPYGKRCRFVHQMCELRAPGDAEGSDSLQLSESEDSTAEIQRKLNELNLSLLAPDPVFLAPVNGVEDVSGNTGKKGSRLPFFQKLRKQKW